MITVSLVNELQFIAATHEKSVDCDLYIGEIGLSLIVFPNLLVVSFNNEEIWREKLATADSNFGVESCTTIYQIMSEILSGKADWRSRHTCDFS